MKAVYYEDFMGAVSVATVPDPTPADDGVIVEVKASGLCLSDWHGWMGHDKDIVLPHVPGHELAGIIVEKGKQIKNLEVGDRVTVPFVSGCGKCPECSTGNHQICDNQYQPGFTGWGSFAQYVALRYADINVVKLPEQIGFSTAASLGCRFATSFRGIVDQGKVKSENWVVVHGCGGIGLSAIMIAKAYGANVVAVDIEDAKLDFARSIGADVTINSKTSPNIVEELITYTEGGAHISVDALGHEEIVMNSLKSLRKRGKHIQIGILSPGTKDARVPTDLFISKELELIGSHGMQAFRYEEMMQKILEEKLDPARLVSETIKLTEVPEQLTTMTQHSSTGIKVITDFS